MKLTASDENEVLTTCALRFEGHDYWEIRCRSYKGGVREVSELVTPVLESGVFPEEPLDLLCAFYMVQRFLGKWGGEYLTEYSNEHVIFRLLFLEAYRLEIPEAFRSDYYCERWDREYRPRQEELAAHIRRTFRRRGRGKKLGI